jgi:hypothetical protein
MTNYPDGMISRWVCECAAVPPVRGRARSVPNGGVNLWASWSLTDMSIQRRPGIGQVTESSETP